MYSVPQILNDPPHLNRLWCSMIKAKHTLYAYVDGFDLEEIAEKLILSLENFISSREWVCKNVKIVNQHHLDDSTPGPGDIQNWDLGLNIDLPDLGEEELGWYSDIIAIATYLGKLYGQIGKAFVIGIRDNNTGISEHLFYIDTKEPNLDELKETIGVGDIE